MSFILNPENAVMEFQREMMLQDTIDRLREGARNGRLPEFKFLLDSTDPESQMQWVTKALQDYHDLRERTPEIPATKTP